MRRSTFFGALLLVPFLQAAHVSTCNCSGSTRWIMSFWLRVCGNMTGLGACGGIVLHGMLLPAAEMLNCCYGMHHEKDWGGDVAFPDHCPHG